MADTSSSSSGGIGFAGLLTVAFIVLKLTHYIDWSWWWVLSPILISTAIAIVFIAGLIVFFVVSDWRDDKRYARMRELRKRHTA